MRKPEESLEDFTVKAIEIEKAAEPEPVASLRFRGEVEVLKPLASRERLAEGDNFVRPAPYRPTWFHRALAFSGGLAVVGLIFLSAIFIGSYEPPAEVATGNLSDAITQQPENGPELTEEPLSSDVFTAQSSPPADVEIPPIRSSAKPRTERPSVQLSAYRPRKKSRRPQLVVTRFVPTTLVIYAENGEIKTRVEPRLAAVYKKPLTVTN